MGTFNELLLGTFTLEFSPVDAAKSFVVWCGLFAAEVVSGDRMKIDSLTLEGEEFSFAGCEIGGISLTLWLFVFCEMST